MSTGKEAAGELFTVTQITRSLHKTKCATHKSTQQPLAYFLGECTCKHSLPHTNVNLLLYTPPNVESFINNCPHVQEYIHNANKSAQNSQGHDMETHNREP